jgi:hypothetical protein
MIAYTVAALMLLMLSSLGGLRGFFRMRRITIPGGLGPFWMGLGTFMVALVVFGAAAMPLPPNPRPAHVERHIYDPFDRAREFQLVKTDITPGEALEQMAFMRQIGRAVLAGFGLFLVYGAVRLLGAVAAAIARDRYRYPRFIVALFGFLDWVLLRLTSLPRRKERRKPIRVDRSLATSNQYVSSMADPTQARNMSVAQHIAYAYDALCALAYDIGVPREPGQTPYEFIASFPRQLGRLKEEAVELTHLHVRSAYSPEYFDERTLDRVRRFWVAYNQVRGKIVR